MWCLLLAMEVPRWKANLNFRSLSHRRMLADPANSRLVKKRAMRENDCSDFTSRLLAEAGIMSPAQRLTALQKSEWTLSHSDFEQIAQIARAAFGLSLTESKKSLIYSRLTKRMKALKLQDFKDYLNRLNGPEGAQEQCELLSVLTTNITHFFRENHHFETLKTEVLPDLIKRAKAGGRVRLWSAGCSTGQEAFSIAMTVTDHFPDAAQYDLKILATDIDPVVVRKGETATYALSELEGLSDAYRKKYMSESTVIPGSLVVDPALQRLITFRPLNLIQPLPVSGPFDAIFCRNVTIYFDHETQEKVWDQLCGVLGHGAYLFIGHSERVSGTFAGCMKKEGFTTMRKS